MEEEKNFLMSPIHHHFELKGWKRLKLSAILYIHLLIIIGGLVLWYWSID